jgi:hypothetical protein
VGGGWGGEAEPNFKLQLEKTIRNMSFSIFCFAWRRSQKQQFLKQRISLVSFSKAPNGVLSKLGYAAIALLSFVMD